MVREEAYYFAPQVMTRTMNEGWASFWHSNILATKRMCEDNELIDYAAHHSATMGSSKSLNPYKLGYEIFKDIEERWNKGRFGKEYEDCKDLVVKEKWDTKAMLGIQKIFEVRKLYNDIGFIDEFFTPELCKKLKLYDYEKQNDEYVITDREFQTIKQRLLFSLSNHGFPTLTVSEIDNKGSLFLKHNTESEFIFNIDDAKEVTTNIQKLWKKPVSLTIENNKVTHIYTNTSGENTVLSTFKKEQEDSHKNYDDDEEHFTHP